MKKVILILMIVIIVVFTSCSSGEIILTAQNPETSAVFPKETTAAELTEENTDIPEIPELTDRSQYTETIAIEPVTQFVVAEITEKIKPEMTVEEVRSVLGDNYGSEYSVDYPIYFTWKLDIIYSLVVCFEDGERDEFYEKFKNGEAVPKAKYAYIYYNDYDNGYTEIVIFNMYEEV